jgi:argininosuccinate lyase
VANKNFKKSLDDIDDQLGSMVAEFVRLRKKHYEAKLRLLHDDLKKDTARYAELWSDGKISKEDCELLIKGRWAQIKVEILTEMSSSKKKFEDIAALLLKTTLKAVFS